MARSSPPKQQPAEITTAHPGHLAPARAASEPSWDPQSLASTAGGAVHALTPRAVLALQRHAGNAAVTRLLRAQIAVARQPIDTDDDAAAEEAKAAGEAEAAESEPGDSLPAAEPESLAEPVRDESVEPAPEESVAEEPVADPAADESAAEPAAGSDGGGPAAAAAFPTPVPFAPDVAPPTLGGPTELPSIPGGGGFKGLLEVGGQALGDGTMAAQSGTLTGGQAIAQGELTMNGASTGVRGMVMVGGDLTIGGVLDAAVIAGIAVVAVLVIGGVLYYVVTEDRPDTGAGGGPPFSTGGGGGPSTPLQVPGTDRTDPATEPETPEPAEAPGAGESEMTEPGDSDPAELPGGAPTEPVLADGDPDDVMGNLERLERVQGSGVDVEDAETLRERLQDPDPEVRRAAEKELRDWERLVPEFSKEVDDMKPSSKGLIGEELVEELARERGGTPIGRHVSFRAADGTRIIADVVWVDASGRLVISESKLGPHARLTPNQARVFPVGPQMLTPFGPNAVAAGLTGSVWVGIEIIRTIID